MTTKNGMLQALAAESAPITATAPAAMSYSLQNRQRGLYQCLLNKAMRCAAAELAMISFIKK